MIHLGKQDIEAIVAFFESFAQHRQPLVHRLKAGLGETAGSPGAIDARCHQSRLFEHFEMLRDCRLRHLEWFGEFRYGCFSEREASENCAACWISECGKGGIEIQMLMHKYILI